MTNTLDVGAEERITAGRLREQGAIINPDIPDHASVPIASIRITTLPGERGDWVKEDGSDVYKTRVTATFTKPFEWDDGT